MLRRRQEAKQLQQQQQQQQQHQMQASVMHQQLASPSDLPPTNSARIEVGSNSQLIPNTQTHGDVDHSTPSDRTGEASGSHQQPREEDASSSQADQVSRQHTDNRWKGRTRGTARKDSCLDEQPVESVKVASESHTALDSEPLPSQRIAKGKGRFKHRTQGKKKKRGEGSGAGESRKHDKKLSSQAHAQSKRCKTRHHRKQRVTELGSLGDVEPVKDSGEHVDQACLGQHHPQRCSKPVAPVAGLQRLCKLLPNSGDAKPLAKEPNLAQICSNLYRHVIITARRRVAGDEFVTEHIVVALAAPTMGWAALQLALTCAKHYLLLKIVTVVASKGKLN